MNNVNEVLLNAGDASGSLNSGVLNMQFLYGVAIQAVFTGSPVGTIKLQGSCDPGTLNIQIAPTSVINWNDISDSSQAVSGSGIVDWNYNGAFFKWLRVVYTSTSGTGTLTITANGKG